MTTTHQQNKELSLSFEDNSLIPLLYGEHNAHLKRIEKTLFVQISDRGNTLSIAGETHNVDLAHDVLLVLWEKLQKEHEVDTQDIDAAIRFARSEDNTPTISNERDRENRNTKTMMNGSREIVTRKKTIHPRSPNQAAYVSALRNYDLAFGIGPGGTGKTYLAVAMAVEMFEKKKVERLIFCRPAVEAGEKLGFLPGDMKEKVDPYLRPVYDALYDFMSVERMEKLIELGQIEIAPLAFMRGRTLSNAFAVLDEAQNTTSAQMKMFLSRMGENSRMVVTGDPDQTDLLPGQKSGLKEAMDILSPLEDVSFTRFQTTDVVRHTLVGKILKAYENAN